MNTLVLLLLVVTTTTQADLGNDDGWNDDWDDDQVKSDDPQSIGASEDLGIDDDDFGDFNETFTDLQAYMANLSSTPSCSPQCPPTWINDGFCDSGCNVSACDFDGEDCDPSKIVQGDDDLDDDFAIDSEDSKADEVKECAAGCHDFMLNDGNCDPVCNVDVCERDEGDCENVSPIADECSNSGCTAEDLGDGFCDSSCNNAPCEYDRGDCDQGSESPPPYSFNTSSATWCHPQCPPYFIGDNMCDNECNNAQCDFDKGDCNGTSTSIEADGDCICPDDWLGDKFCDDECNNAECSYDKGDCKVEAVPPAFSAFSAVRITKKGSQSHSNSSFTFKQLPPLIVPHAHDGIEVHISKTGRRTAFAVLFFCYCVAVVLYRRTKMLREQAANPGYGHVILPSDDDYEEGGLYGV